MGFRHQVQLDSVLFFRNRTFRCNRQTREKNIFVPAVPRERHKRSAQKAHEARKKSREEKSATPAQKSEAKHEHNCTHGCMGGCRTRSRSFPLLYFSHMNCIDTWVSAIMVSFIDYFPFIGIHNRSEYAKILKWSALIRRLCRNPFSSCIDFLAEAQQWNFLSLYWSILRVLESIIAVASFSATEWKIAP